MKSRIGRLLLMVGAMALVSCIVHVPPPKEPPKGEDPDVKPDGKQEELVFAKEIEARLARFAPTDVDFDDKLVPDDLKPVLKKLVHAGQVMDDIYLEQVSADNPGLRVRLAEQKAPASVIDYFDIMFGPWDRLNGDEPFIGAAEKPKTAAFYPTDLTAEELKAWIKAHPDQEKAFASYFSVIRRDGDKLVAVPYNEAYKEKLHRAAAMLNDAAELAKHPALKNYLNLRADAFLANDYYESDKAWMDLGDSPVEVVIGPYEVYEDRLMGYKAAFEAFITLRDPVESEKLAKLAKYLEPLEKNLPLPAKYMTKRGSESPISVVIEVFTAGDTKAGVQTAAFNLPNDERVRKEKGSKKVLLKNVTEAKFNKVLVPISKKVIDPALHGKITFDAYFNDILLHEMAHGLGPGTIQKDGKQTTVNKELRELYPAIEECKADIVGLVNAKFLVEKKVLGQALLEQLPVTYTAGIFRAVRFGAEEAHARGVLLAFNYLLDKGAITYDADAKRYGVNQATFYKGVRDLAGELLMAQAKGDYNACKEMLEKYGVVRPEMQQALDALGDVPVDIRPNYTIVEKMKNW